jgi:hypothetical protein
MANAVSHRLAGMDRENAQSGVSERGQSPPSLVVKQVEP